MTASGKRCLLRCHACETRCSDTSDTAFFDLRTPQEKVLFALKLLWVRVDLSGLSFVLGATQATGLARITCRYANGLSSPRRSTTLLDRS